MKFYQPKFFKEWLVIYKNNGFKELLKKKGWTVIITIFLFYLIRDSFLYLFLPYVVFSNINSCF